ncbi:MAG: Spy/CpxP family protein refolding chaperone [Calditrichaceae bacterium]|nr:Spy/CpxP family protein refolding chaperone [Calditrichaceae bacterium]MBN2709288.1 Spy/CpxP family protein refolding chaperone [Calditrichaceae bacterium]RQV91984.1 MAG: hypothetical protein EH224_16790 [Calditrichota bacterium]
MYKHIPILMIMLIFAASVFAQKPERAERIDKQIARLDKALNLSADQKSKITEILEQSQKEMIKDRDANKDDPRAMREAVNARREITDIQIKNVLTDEQKTKFEEFQKSRTARMQVDELDEALNLTDEQEAKIEKIFQARDDKMKSMRDEADSRPTEERREQMRAEMKAVNNEILKVLNEEQKEKYKEMIKERMEGMRGRGPGQRGPRF